MKLLQMQCFHPLNKDIWSWNRNLYKILLGRLNLMGRSQFLALSMILFSDDTDNAYFYSKINVIYIYKYAHNLSLELI